MFQNNKVNPNDLVGISKEKQELDGTDLRTYGICKGLIDNDLVTICCFTLQEKMTGFDRNCAETFRTKIGC